MYCFTTNKRIPNQDMTSQGCLEIFSEDTLKQKVVLEIQSVYRQREMLGDQLLPLAKATHLLPYKVKLPAGCRRTWRIFIWSSYSTPQSSIPAYIRDMTIIRQLQKNALLIYTTWNHNEHANNPTCHVCVLIHPKGSSLGFWNQIERRNNWNNSNDA